MMVFLVYIYLVVFILFDIVLLVYGVGLLYACVNRIAPPVHSGRRLRRAVADQIALQCPNVKTIMDIGSGWGTMVRTVANRFPNAHVTGIELTPLPYFYSIVRFVFIRNKSLILGDAFKFLDSPDKHFDIGITYLLPSEMADVKKLLSKFDTVLALDFPLPDTVPHKKIKLHHDILGQHWLYVYKS